MERSLAGELYSEILKPEIELGQTSIPDMKQSHSLVSEDEEWCEDESLWNDSDKVFDTSSELDREWKRRQDQFHAIGYRDGIIAGKEASAQQGFNIGFKESVTVGFNWGLVRGVTGALDSLSDELKEKIIKSGETRNKFHDLYESVNKLSTIDALNIFGKSLSKIKAKEELNSDDNVLDTYYGQLQSLISDSPAIRG